MSDDIFYTKISETNAGNIFQNRNSGRAMMSAAILGFVVWGADAHKIAAELLSDKVKLESAVKEAVNDTIKKVQRVMAQKMSQMGGLNLPGMK